jgi:hypothetical protein
MMDKCAGGTKKEDANSQLSGKPPTEAHDRFKRLVAPSSWQEIFQVLIVIMERPAPIRSAWVTL